MAWISFPYPTLVNGSGERKALGRVPSSYYFSAVTIRKSSSSQKGRFCSAVPFVLDTLEGMSAKGNGTISIPGNYSTALTFRASMLVELLNSDLRSVLSPLSSFYYSRFFADDQTLYLQLKASTLQTFGVTDTGIFLGGEAETRTFFVLIKLCYLTFLNFDGGFAGVSTINRGLDPSMQDIISLLLVLSLLSSFVGLLFGRGLKTLSFVSTISCFSSSRTTSRPSLSS